MEETVKKRMLSGIKPSGDLTLGSYLGAVKNWAERADQYDCFYFMADLHAITVRQNPADLRRRTLEHRLWSGPGEEHPVYSEPYPPARGAGLGSGLLFHVR